MDAVEGPRSGAATSRPGGRAVGLALSCHPGPVAAVSALTVALCVLVGLSAPRCLLVGGAVLTGQLSVGWCNDAFDVRRDAAAGRRGKPVARGAVSPGAVWAAAFGALALCVPLSLACGLLAGAVHLTGVAAAWAYNVRLKATALSWLPYAIGFGTLPAVVTLSLPGHPWPAWWATAAGALLGVAAHLADSLGDIPDDVAAGIRGLPHRLGVTGTRLSLPVPLVAATAVLALGPEGTAGVDGVAVALVAGAAAVGLAGPVPGRWWRKTAFAGAVAVAAADVALLLARGSSIV
ncbi:UbiA family prenyltransferase [Streptomyces sp. NPDC053755]|uniref:UbiA family prenyltransferase n=1 Tax=Streptomyces sp. NPDC053755 TaxID=3155815 RepID=UPI00341512B5